ncbi:CCRP1 [Symbiodinium sp. CCMP2456]|nr:CCRP1 [Symbiodinium sp. CCMP2456]
MSSAMKASKASKTSHGGSPGNASPTNGSQKVVGPNIKGNREEYQLVMHLQSALFGGVYEAKGRSSGKDYAIKVLHKSELQKVEENDSIEFCEVPLSELKFADVMKGHEHVMEVEEHFEDQYCHYCVFELCRGGDLLEALKQKPMGFDERQAQFLIRQAVLGLAHLHDRGVAMQDVSLENMLLNINPSSGHWQVKICDPGQAVRFQTDSNGQEKPVGFHGLVGKSFRPPELHDHKPYLATKVDSWCLGWSTFYLLTAQPLFMSADPALKDTDWQLFKSGKFDELFKTKSPNFSPTGIDFIFKLLQFEPSKRMSIADACSLAWLNDASVQPVPAPKELLPDSLIRTNEVQVPAPVPSKPAPPIAERPDFMGGSLSASIPSMTASLGAPTIGSPMRPMTHTLPTWSAAPIQGVVSTTTKMVAPRTPLMRVRSPSSRSPRQSFAAEVQLVPSADRRSRAFQPQRRSQRRHRILLLTSRTGRIPQRLCLGSPEKKPKSWPPAYGAWGLPYVLQGMWWWPRPIHQLPWHCVAHPGGLCRTPIANARSRLSNSRPRPSATLAPSPLPLAEASSEQRGRPLWAFGGPTKEGAPPRMGSGTSDFQGPARAASPVPVASMAMPRVASPGPPGGISFVAADGRRALSPARHVALPEKL